MDARTSNTASPLTADLSSTECLARQSARAATPRRMKRPLRKWIGVACSLSLTVLSGCTSFSEYVHNGFKVGPNYLRPTAPVEQDWIDVADKRVASESVDMSHWWTTFQDPVLDSLILESYEQNLTLREAGFRVLQARAQRNIQVGNLFPQQQGAFGSYTRNEISKKNPNTSFIPLRFTSQYQVGFNLAWEIDFWGRFRRAVEAAEGDLDASVEGYDAVLVTLQGDIAQTYIEIRTIERQLTLVRANVDLQQQTLNLTDARAKAGLTSELDLAQAQSNLSQTQALIPQFEADLRVATNRMSVLMGLPPTTLEARLGAAPIPKAPGAIRVGIPAELLARRPDVRRAERQAAAQSARIGVATADLYPRISILGTIGSSSARFQNLLSDESFFGSVGPSYQWNILNYGRLKNNILLQDSRFQELVATYQRTVLQAEQEAENGIVRYRKAQERAEALAVSVTASEKAVQLALTQYKGGLVDFNRIALLELNLVQQQDLLAQAQGNIALGLIEVYRALGGGWEDRLNPNQTPMPAGPPRQAEPSPVDPEISVPVPDVEPQPAPAEPAANPAPQSNRKLRSPARGISMIGDIP
jgi:NodT family efflux transporter outer membrane factor (OMF) lipoprotein